MLSARVSLCTNHRDADEFLPVLAGAAQHAPLCALFPAGAFGAHKKLPFFFLPWPCMKATHNPKPQCQATPTFPQQTKCPEVRYLLIWAPCPVLHFPTPGPVCDSHISGAKHPSTFGSPVAWNIRFACDLGLTAYLDTLLCRMHFLFEWWGFTSLFVALSLEAVASFDTFQCIIQSEDMESLLGAWASTQANYAFLHFGQLKSRKFPELIFLALWPLTIPIQAM